MEGKSDPSGSVLLKYLNNQSNAGYVICNGCEALYVYEKLVKPMSSLCLG